ncbi:hypothetical protein ASF37_02815 [Aeromicrobium sp. Leaf289]|uniref:hypothetical protein n=1 Tax=Aeromicrobium sp. Leaf289 TaxID=1736324 RepID=UPI0006FA7006|nr:hypothetical protein [Aeromicrobium sp. Leaf289]KQP79950.1 hypothetical protein ASF37_02815 [Aeromicrobium sp. Leaf289]
MATPEPAQATPATDDARPTRSYEDLVPGSLAWIAATHGGSSDDGAAELEDQPGDHARRDAGDRRRAAKQAKAEKRLAARRAREEQRAAAKAEKDRARRERAEAKDREAAERAEAKEREAEQAEARRAAQEVEDERTRQLAEEQAAAARVEQDRRRQAESAAAEQKAQRREKSKAAALAALAGRPTTARADAPTSQDVADQDAAPEDPDAQDPMPGDGTSEQESTTTRSEDGSAADLAAETALLDAVGAAHQDLEATEDVEATEATEVTEADAQDARADARESEHTSQEPVDRGGRGDDRRAAAAATVARRREKAEAKERARAEKGEAARRRRAEKAPAREIDDSVPEPPSVPQESSSFGPARVVSLVGVAIGVLGLVASVLLALAALLVAFGFDADAGVLRAVAVVADPLTAPLRGLVAFSGENAAAKEAFVAYGGGSVVYLIVGVAAPSLLSRRDA